MKRRTVLGGITALSVGVLSPASLSIFASSQNAASGTMPPSAANSTEFRAAEIKTSDNRVFVRIYGKGKRPGILLVHGFPRTSLMWRHLAPRFADRYTVVCADLRGYGHSGSPPSTDDHFPYSKRAMASELVEVMQQIGFANFTLVGHDRGGRVSYRMALDYPDKVDKLAVFDVIPIFEAWSRTDAKFAQTYWPWILLSQKDPLPERYLLGAPDAAFDNPFGAGTFPKEIREQYVEMYKDPACVHAVCEEYRAAATIDVEHDRKDVDARNQITCPMLHLWATGGPLDTFYSKAGGPLGIWRQRAPNVQGQTIKGGHFFPERTRLKQRSNCKTFFSPEQRAHDMWQPSLQALNQRSQIASESENQS
jgi:haloacetate dehalogenase